MKNVAVFVGELQNEFQNKASNKLNEICKKENINLTYFHNFCVFGSNVFYAYMERNIINLPDYKKYDGIILFNDSYGITGMEAELELKLKNLSIPVVSIRKESDTFYNVLNDDYTSMCNMIEHFITEHGFRKIAFMKGRYDFKDAAIRYMAYEDTMAKYNIPITEHMTFDGNYWKNLGGVAVDWFLSGKEKPEAIVCANDYMAVSVIEALQSKGIKVPEDIAVSGYDNLLDSIACKPTLTTIDANVDDMMMKTVDILKAKWDGKEIAKNHYVVNNCLYRESCPCNQHVDEMSMRELISQNSLLTSALSNASLLFINFDNIKTFDELLYTLSYYLFETSNKEYFDICLYMEKNIFATDVERQVILKGRVAANKAEILNEPFNSKKILPEKYQTQSVMTVSLLHDTNDIYGYIVTQPFLSQQTSCFIKLFSQAISNWLSKNKLIIENNTLTDRLQESKYDELTKIYNRKTFNTEIKSVYQRLIEFNEEFFICSIDMDYLKDINDNFGHLAGDNALFQIAAIINKNCSSAETVCARVGGDEFMACFKTADENIVINTIEAIRKDIAEFNTNSNLPYELSISIGYAKCNSNSMLTQVISIADTRMYDEKKKKKQNK